MARHLGTAGRMEVDADRAVTTRPSSTALLSVDSLDREQTPTNQSSGNFLINKKQAIFNGFFHRIALVELVLDWCIPNISGKYSPANNVFAVDLVPGPGSFSASLPAGNYTVADALNKIIALLNASAGAGSFRIEDSTGAAWVPGTSTGNPFLGSTIGDFVVVAGELAQELGIQSGGPGALAYPIVCPKLLPIYYIDFVSPQLTYNQDLKDSTTSEIVRDALYRWVFAYDNGPIPLDAYNFPILQGYKPFISRRSLNYPKQILWNSASPIGQLGFQLYTSYGDILDPAELVGTCEYQLSLLLSEN